MLLQIRKFISQQGFVSLKQLTRAFHIDEHALEPMLMIWIKKGVIAPYEPNMNCKGSCQRCKTEIPVYYQYVAKA